MNRTSIILHAPDGAKFVDDLKQSLVSKHIQVTTFSEFKRSIGVDLPEALLFQVVIEHFDTVICLITSGVFANCHLSSAIRCAVGLNKLVSVQPREQPLVILPGWFLYSFMGKDVTFDQVVSRLLSSPTQP